MRVFRRETERRRYLFFVREEAERFGVEIRAWCLMDNHVHFIAVPSDEEALARTFGEAHRRYTGMRNRRDGVSGYLFQGRFYSTVLDERHLVAAIRYVELNPVRAGMVRNAWDYAWSSAAYHAGLRDEDPLVANRALPEQYGDWKEFLREPLEEERESLLRATRTGRPAGDRFFAAALSELTGRNLKPGKPGRPRKVAEEPGA